MEFKINQCQYDLKSFIKDNICKEFNIDYWDKWLEQQEYDLLQKYPNILISVEEDNTLIGICGVRVLNEKECYLNSFYVKKEYRNKKIGTKIFNMCMDYIIKNKFQKIILTVDPKFIIAQKFYENRGFIFNYLDKKNQELHYFKYLY